MELEVTNPLYIFGDPTIEKPAIEAVDSSGAIVWTATAGTLAVVGNIATLTPPNQTRSIIVYAEDSEEERQGTVQILARFPLHAYFPHSAQIGQKMEYSQSEDATPESEMSSARGTEYIVFNYVALDRPLTDYKLLRDFARLNRGQWFYYVDRAAEETLFCRFDSDVERKTNQFEHFDLTCVLRGKIIYNAAPDNIGSAG